MFEIRRISDHSRLGLLDLKAYSDQNSINVKRELEQKGTLFLLEQLINKEAAEKLSYTAENKPFLKDHPEHISISHSHDKLAILVNENESCGVDIELIREKVLKVRHKFLNPQERNFCKEDIELLITFWAAKETLYKIDGKKELDFAEHLAVEFTTGKDFRGYIQRNGNTRSYLLRRENLQDYILVYSLREV